MTTQAPARATDRPIPSPFTGAGKLWCATFLSHILNPWNMAFALLLPMFMYAMFGMTDVARATQTGRGNLAAAMIAMLTTYGVILVGGSLGATRSVERTTGISRMYALTPIQPWVILLVRLTALVALSAFITLITFSFGLATGAQMTPGAWAASAAVIMRFRVPSTEFASPLREEERTVVVPSGVADSVIIHFQLARSIMGHQSYAYL